MIAAIIPARGGSKGIPQKNIQPLAGKPLLAWTIDQARAAQLIERVYVTTDDTRIAEVAAKHGAEVIWRPAELAGDNATSESALTHALDVITEDIDYVVFLQATSPLRQPNDIDNAIKWCVSHDADACFSARRIEGYTWNWNGRLQARYSKRERRQDRDDCELEENGSIYVFRPWVLRQYGERLGGRVIAYIQGVLESFQVDEPDDLELMELLANKRFSER